MADMHVRTRHSWLASLLLIPAFVVAALFGFIIVLVVLGAVMLAVLIILVRLWWLNRRRRQTPGEGALEGEFVVIREHLRSEQKPRD